MKKRMLEYRIRVKGIFCVYCGEMADSVDHFPPKSASVMGFLLPACKECNNLAGTDYPFDFENRAKLVTEKLRKKYNKILGTSEWSKDEMRELKYSLNRMVRSWEELRKIIRRRIAWNAISYLSCTALTRNFVQFNVEISSTPGSARGAFAKHMKSYIRQGPNSFD